MARRLKKTLVDYLVIAISPALIITLVGSLVFFLLEVFYHGNFQLRLHCVFALFIIGAVLISRISIEGGRERAAMFALPLAIVTLLAINKFVRFQGDVSASLGFCINVGLIALTWWSADKLTWDCTLIDEDEEDSGEGLLEAVGLDRPGKAALQKEIAALAGQGEPVATDSQQRKPAGWWERFWVRRRRPHAPGVWIVYFSLAALPLFGIGQMFLPAGSLAARQYAFCLLCTYTASGLGLLLATNFLGLRRYLRQRRQEMPLAMVNLWLVIGGLLIVGVMLAAMLLPRPNAEYAVSELPFRFGSPDQKSSRYGRGREGVKEDRPERTADSGPRPPDTPATGKPPSGNTSAQRPGDDGRPDNVPRMPPMPHPALPPVPSPLLLACQWLLYGALALLAIFAVWWNRNKLLAAIGNFRRWLADFWRHLFAAAASDAGADEDQAGSGKAPLPRFADFRDPFAEGIAGQYRPEELVRYTFEALEAWARDHGHPRAPEQTPHEFTRRLVSQVSLLADDAGRLADLYCQVAYAPGTPPAAQVARLSHLWQKLRTAADAEVLGV